MAPGRLPAAPRCCVPRLRGEALGRLGILVTGIKRWQKATWKVSTHSERSLQKRPHLSALPATGPFASKSPCFCAFSPNNYIFSTLGNAILGCSLGKRHETLPPTPSPPPQSHTRGVPRCSSPRPCKQKPQGSAAPSPGSCRAVPCRAGPCRAVSPGCRGCRPVTTTEARPALVAVAAGPGPRYNRGYKRGGAATPPGAASPGPGRQNQRPPCRPPRAPGGVDGTGQTEQPVPSPAPAFERAAGQPWPTA